MREKKAFAERTKTRENDEVLRKYFLVFEGTETEIKYFEALEIKRKDLGINPLIDLCPIVRNFHEMGWSNPKKILQELIKNIEESLSGKISYESMIERMLEYLSSAQLLQDNTKNVADIRKDLCSIYRGNLSKPVEDLEDVCEKMLDTLQNKINNEATVEKIVENIKKQDIVYAENFDKICLIVDRDRKSFIVNERINQYQEVVSICQEKKIQLYISNPCFEFWLLLHFDEVKELNQKALLENAKVGRKYTYAEKELRRLLPGYKKNFYNTEVLLKNIEKAIKNSELFSVNIEELENKIGCNIYQLILELRKLNTNNQAT